MILRSFASDHPLDEWKWRRPYPVGSSLKAGAFGDGVFVAGGAGGVLITSTNGSDWIQVNSHIKEDIKDLAFGNGVFVGVGWTNHVLVSRNGVDWRDQQLGSNWFSRVIFGRDRFVIAATNTMWLVNQLSSTDGVQWTFHVAPLIHDIAFGNGVWVILSNDGNVFTSSDAVNWNWNFLGVRSSGRIKYGNGRFVVTTVRGQVFTSELGTGWVEQSSVPALNVAGFANGLFFGNRYSREWFVSVDGAKWRQLADAPSRVEAVMHGNERWVAVGEAGATLISMNGTNWTSVSSRNDRANLNVVRFLDGQFVAGGDGVILTSADGVEWRAAEVDGSVQAVARGAGVLVAVGSNGTSNRGAGIVLSSGDGLTFQKRYLATRGLTGITFGNGEFAAVGLDGVIYTSKDGVEWKARFVFGGNLSHVAFGNGKFVAAGRSTNLVAITLTWATDEEPVQTREEPVQTRQGDGIFRRFLQFQDGRFYLVLGNGLLTSTDGIAWARHELSNLFVTDLAVAGSFYAGVAGSFVFSSPDLGDWVRSFNSGARDVIGGQLTSIAWGNQTLVAVGSNGTIVQSGRIHAPLIRIEEGKWANTLFEFRVRAPVGWPLRILTSKELVEWQTLDVVREHDGFPLVKPTAPYPSAFYQIRSP